MKIDAIHDWDISAAEAISLQKSLAGRIIYDQPVNVNQMTTVGGVDVSVKNDPVTGEATSHAAVTVLSFPDMQLIETVTATMTTPFPYIPGLLSFREGPVILKAIKNLQIIPDAFIFDGMGRAHPRRIGIASHMGLWFNKPTIGCGKTLLIGSYDEPPQERGTYSPLIDRGELVGVVLRTRPNVKPLYISVGHLCDLATAVEIVMRCVGKYRLPEPIRAAHNAAGNFGGESEA